MFYLGCDRLRKMDDETLIAKFLKINEDLYAKAKSPMKSHGPDHHYRVCLNALKLVKKLDFKVDMEVLIPAALLHDLAAYHPEIIGENYHDFDYQLAEEVLKKENYPEEKIKSVLEVIKNHGSDPKFKKEDEAVEVSILRDADKFESLGAIGVARIIMARTERGDTLQKIVKDFYHDGRIQRKFDSITFPESKEMIKKDYEYSLSYFKQLAELLAGE